MLEESMADFNGKIYAHLSQSQPTQNLLYSPISISAILSHLLLGARGETRRQLEAALCLPHGFLCVHSQMKALKESLQASLQMASQVYYSPHLNLSESFANQSLQFYEAKPVKLLANSEQNAELINSWVAQKTNNKITKLVNEVSADTQLILLNAVAFSGQWKLRFDETHKAPFMKLNGDLVKVPVLFSSKYKLAMTHIPAVKAQVGRFPLSGDSSLFILLPSTATPSDLQRVEGQLTDANVRHMAEHLKKLSLETIEVTLPKIKLNVQTEMNTLLRKLGLSSLFEDPNLCGLYPDDRLLLTDARHRAFLALTESGVEAGAATSLSFSRSYASFSALRPFILILWSDAANVPLFMGRVVEP
ncbi:plasma protease C1 inhibitor [Aplochiton taeniatus]